MARIKTRILILSDTHGHSPVSTRAEDDLSLTSDFCLATTGYREPLPSADVALHCGDLTTRTTPWEFRRTVAMLRSLRASLKIVIPGNHDRALDEAFWTSTQDSGNGYVMTKDPEYRTEALELLEEAKKDGVVYIGKEGEYSFPLANGAVLRIYASPWTPEYGTWGFQYSPETGHDFHIPAGIDIAMTHGPPRDVLDLAGFNLPQYNMQLEHAGCPDLFTAVARARPRIHCFGHIHEAWGAYLARWRADTKTTEKHTTVEKAIDAVASRSIVRLQDIKPMTVLDPPATEEQAKQLMEWSRQMGVHINLEEARGEGHEVEDTLFLNAAIEGHRQKPSQLPFIIDMLLDKTT
ncbi:Metallophosphoesterase [Akanthomyces lecanii RCEF 1005]|uniref:Metallophosphoesterase n=1 Tax=Akanthomyces lecanii RCEF 1005 TaxID=1081108 RepID=A0A162KIG2_CORDF|nr:Metallophosphoesterase [Akanthomyces lecanii RCEF 1005]